MPKLVNVCVNSVEFKVGYGFVFRFVYHRPDLCPINKIALLVDGVSGHFKLYYYSSSACVGSFVG